MSRYLDLGDGLVLRLRTAAPSRDGQCDAWLVVDLPDGRSLDLDASTDGIELALVAVAELVRARCAMKPRRYRTVEEEADAAAEAEALAAFRAAVDDHCRRVGVQRPWLAATVERAITEWVSLRDPRAPLVELARHTVALLRALTARGK